MPLWASLPRDGEKVPLHPSSCRLLKRPAPELCRLRLSGFQTLLSLQGRTWAQHAVSTPLWPMRLISWAPDSLLPCPPHTQIMKSLSKEAPNALLPWEASQRCWTCHFSPPHPPRFQGSSQMPQPSLQIPLQPDSLLLHAWLCGGRRAPTLSPFPAFSVASEHRSDSGVPHPHPYPTLGRSVLLRKRIRAFFSPIGMSFSCVFIKFSSRWKIYHLV